MINGAIQPTDVYNLFKVICTPIFAPADAVPTVPPPPGTQKELGWECIFMSMTTTVVIKLPWISVLLPVSRLGL